MWESKNIKRIFSQPLKVGGILGGVFGFASDFLQPLAEVGYILATACFVIILLSLLAKAVPPLDELLYEKINGVWYAPLFVTLVTFSIILSVANYASLKYGNNQQGILATNSVFIKGIQKNIISIEESLNIIRDSQKQADIKLDTINQDQKTLSQTVYLNVEQLKQSMLSGNIVAVKSFHQQGGDFNLLNSAPPGYIGYDEAIIVSLVKNVNKNTVAILDYILNNSSIDPDALFPVNTFSSRLYDAYLSLIKSDSEKRDRIMLEAYKYCKTAYRNVCAQERYSSMLKDEHFNIDEFGNLKAAMSSLIDEAYNAGNVDVVKYLKSKNVKQNNYGYIVLESGQKIQIKSPVINLNTAAQSEL